MGAAMLPDAAESAGGVPSLAWGVVLAAAEVWVKAEAVLSGVGRLMDK
jgi:hypothetical protein